MRPDDDTPADLALGGQAERTEMAWVRTALACAGLAAVTLHVVDADTTLLLVLALGVAVAMPGLVAAWWRVGELRRRPEPAPPRVAGVALLAGTVVVVDLVVLLRLVS